MHRNGERPTTARTDVVLVRLIVIEESYGIAGSITRTSTAEQRRVRPSRPSEARERGGSVPELPAFVSDDFLSGQTMLLLQRWILGVAENEQGDDTDGLGDAEDFLDSILPTSPFPAPDSVAPVRRRWYPG
jgi:hypothetical protein